MKAVYKHNGARQTSQESANRVWGDPEAMARIAEAGANKRDVWTIATTPYADAHFATFPVELPLTCIRAGSRPGDLVLDPFMGSGTVAEAAESLGRTWTGYELNPAYHALIAERTRQRGLLVEAGQAAEGGQQP
jgi:site-specific DNA-methyltransferase (cytosine-N4-specific)